MLVSRLSLVYNMLKGILVVGCLPPERRFGIDEETCICIKGITLCLYHFVPRYSPNNRNKKRHLIFYKD